MTVSSTDSRADFAGDGTSTSFTIPYFFIADNDIEALLTSTGGTETVFVDGTEYTLSGKGVASGGELTLVSTDFVPKTGEKLTIRRLEQFTQPTDLAVQGALPSATLEEGYDRLTMLSQQLKEGQSRIMIAPAGESGVDLTLPSTGTRANKFLAYDGEAKPIASAGIAGSTDVPVSAFMEDVVAAVDGSTALEILGAQPSTSISTFMGTVLDDAGSTEALGTLSALGQGIFEVPIPASAFVARDTNGAAVATVELATNNIMIDVFDFDAATEEAIQYRIPFMPRSWDEGTVTATVAWETTSTSGDVVWGVSGLASGDLDTLDTALGTEVKVTDSSTAANKRLTSPESTNITIGGTPAAQDDMVVQVARKAASTADTLGTDARFLGLRLRVNFNAVNDA